MTQQEFFAYVQLFPNELSIWYNEIAPPYIIQAISVPVVDANYQDITNYLTQVQQLIVPLQSGDSVTLNILNRQLINNNNGTCYYFDVVYTEVPTISPLVETNTNIQLLPAIDQAEFYDSPYNVLQGSVERLRSSAYIMQSDRYRIGTLANPTYTGPLNIELLLSGSASLAHVQDSNYTTTGWVNGRYEGSKTSRVDYKTDPAIAGSLFKGAEFPSGSTVTQVDYTQKNGQVTYKEMFFAGVGNSPGYSPSDSGYWYTGSIPLNDYTTLLYITPASSNILPPPKVGSLIKLDTEIMRINQVGYNPQTWAQYSLLVTRAINSSVGTHDNRTPITNVSQVQIYNISGDRLTGVPRGTVLVQETGQLLELDSLGYVLSATDIPAF